MMKISELLEQNKLIMDGAMGTYYSSKYNTHLVSELANIDAPDKIVEIHKEYLMAGANIIRTNSFAINSEVLNVNRKEQEVIIAASVHNAKKAIELYKREISTEKDIYIACSIGPIPVKNDRQEEDVFEEYKLICDSFLSQKVDIILFETFSDFTYIIPVAKYIKEKNKEVCVLATFCLNKNGYTTSGVSAARILDEIEQCEEIDGGGFNCGIGSRHMYQILKQQNLSSNKVVLALPNASYPAQYSNRMVFMNNEVYFGNNMEEIHGLGVTIVGGCCGTNPNYIEYLNKNINLEGKKVRKTIASNVSSNLVVEVKENELMKKFKEGKKVVAVELDPPFDANDTKIMECTNILKHQDIDIITIADSPMGRSRVDSILMGIKLHNEINVPVMPHMCCRDKNLIAMRSSILGGYINGVRNLLLVTGDPIPSDQRQSITGVFDHNSVRLMKYVNDMNKEHFNTDPIVFGGALNYGRGNIDKVIERMNQKIEAGAQYFLTQPIYSDEDVERIRYIKEKVDTKILCGIMPLVSYRNANFIKNEITGIHVPDEIIERYHMDMTKEEGEVVGGQIASEIISKLSQFADGYYFMLPFNRVSLMDKIVIK